MRARARASIFMISASVLGDGSEKPSKPAAPRREAGRRVQPPRRAACRVAAAASERSMERRKVRPAATQPS